MICIVDLGTGNLRSLSNGLRQRGIQAAPCATPPVRRPEAVILPGVGAFGHAAAELDRLGWSRAWW